MTHKTLQAGMRGPRICLKRLDNTHSDFVIEWRNSSENKASFLSDAVITKSSHQNWLASRNDIDETNWVIVDERCEPLGLISLYNIDWSRKTAEFGRLLIGNKERRGIGLAAEATNMVLNLAASAGLEYIYLIVKCDNLKAISLYCKLGFSEVSRSNNLIYMARSIVGREILIDAS